MKSKFNIYNKIVLTVSIAFATLMTSCTDYLTIIPPDKIVHEKFWQTEDEVNGMLATSYLKLLSGDAISRAIVWGESRSDAMKYPASNTSLKYIMEANILDDNGYANWARFYEAINYANLVIEYAPSVRESDPDFEPGDLDVVLGEMYAMRALCHFYLVRTFRDIPLAVVPAANDADLPAYEQVHPLEALDQIMKDLEFAEGKVRKSVKSSNKAQSYGRITQNAVLAMKADVSLWRAAFATYYEGQSELVAAGDADKYYVDCINNCEAVMTNMLALYKEEYPEAKDPDKYWLIENEGEKIKDTKQSTAFDKIFGDGNSVESIFELQLEGSNADGPKGEFSGGVYSMYGYQTNYGQVVVPDDFLKKYENDDLRLYSYIKQPESSSETNNAIMKYVAKTSPVNGTREYRQDNNFNANWIVYRKTDVMLMQAEAYALMSTSGTEEFKEAFKLVNAINRRWRADTAKITKPLVENAYLSKKECIDLVLDERARELAFEGKRWYDLVRKALRDKSTSEIVFVADKLDNNGNAVKTKMSTIDGLFFPIYIDELRFNKNLKQNPAYADSESTTEMVK